MKVLPRVRLRGRIRPPGDKSVGHRLALLAAIARGGSRLEGFAPGQDCASTVGMIESLGVATERRGDVLQVEGRGEPGLAAPSEPLDAGNSGSTARMACGLLAGQPFESRLVGDESLSRRPFDRVVAPLSTMGASFESTGGSLPLLIRGTAELRGIDYELPVASAQVKTAVLLAGLFAEGTTSVREAVPSRNHTEIALAAFGAPPLVRGGEVRVTGGTPLHGARLRLPGDFSSAAFFIGAAAFLPGSELVVENVGINPTRTAFLDVLKDMGAEIEIHPAPTSENEEPVGTVVVRGRELHGANVTAETIPALIDELPILAVVAAFSRGTTRVEGASELRVKESDRLAAIVEGLGELGADVEATTNDGLEIRGGRELHPARLRSFGDHRMVMAWAIASLGVPGECAIDHLDQVRISYPGFWQTMEQLVH